VMWGLSDYHVKRRSNTTIIGYPPEEWNLGI
jgi:hypothetical protein